MSKANISAPKTIFASKTTFDALAVDSGEETEEEHLSVAENAQGSAPQEPVKPTKSAIKKAQRVARMEARQREKQNKAAARRKEASGASSDDTPADPKCLNPVVEEASIEPPVTGRAPELTFPTEAALQEKDSSNGPTFVSKESPTIEKEGSVAPKTSPALPIPKPKVGSRISENHISVPSPPANGSVSKSVPEKDGAVDSEQIKKRQNVLTRVIWTFIMIGGFIGLLLLGHTYMILLVMLCQTLVYREVTALFSLKTATPESRDVEPLKGRDPWSKTLNWYFFAVTNYFLYGESIIYYFKHVVFADANLLPFATNHRMISFTLYIIGFMGFVMSLKKGYLKQQFGLFCWVHMSLLLIVVSSHFIVNNILEGLIWFWVPASLVICNDCFAYIWGVTVGRTPLIKLSPKKTVEGFVGAFISTMIFSVFWGAYFMRFNYMICPVHDLGVSAWNSTQCTPNPVFVWKTWKLWQPLSSFLNSVTGHTVNTISYAPYQFHLLVLAGFASLVAPFGGFFASGFKRAFNIKDFGHSIPGHGGMTDRMDCQFLMGIFTYVYYSSLIRVHHVTVGGILQTIVSGLTVDQQLELINDLSRYLEGQGIVVS